MTNSQIIDALKRYDAPVETVRHLSGLLSDITLENAGSRLGVPDVVLCLQSDAGKTTIYENIYYRHWKPIYLKLRVESGETMVMIGMYKGIWVVGKDFCLNFTVPFLPSPPFGPITLGTAMTRIHIDNACSSKLLKFELRTRNKTLLIDWSTKESTILSTMLEDGDEIILPLTRSQLRNSLR